MLNRKDYNLGIMFRREHAPEKLPSLARRAEEAGFDELWVVEDCFYGSGIASAAAALACTDSIKVGVGIMPAVVRNPVFAAMEIATLALSGRVADGTILAEYAAPAYVSWALEQIARGVQEAGSDREHRLTVFALTCADSPTATAHQQMRPLIASAIASGGIDVQIAPMGILPQVQEYMKSRGQERLEAALPDAWIDQLAIAGTPEEWALAIRRLVEAGANTVVLVPLPDKGLDELDVFARHLLR